MTEIYMAQHFFGPMGVAVSPDRVAMMAYLSELARENGRLNWDDLVVSRHTVDDEDGWVVFVPQGGQSRLPLTTGTRVMWHDRGNALASLAREVRALGIPTSHWM